jgi:hypothetical protein
MGLLASAGHLLALGFFAVFVVGKSTRPLALAFGFGSWQLLGAVAHAWWWCWLPHAESRELFLQSCSSQ